MNRLLAILFFASALVCPAAGASPPWPVLDSFSDLRTVFAQPPAGYSTAPFLVWNGTVTEKDIDAFLTDYKAHGITSVIVHPRVGLVTSYLSERWYQLIRHTVDKAKSLGMLVWLYDENGYPSGSAGGKVNATMPESWNQGSGLVLKKLTAPQSPDLAGCKVLLRKSGDRFEEAASASAPGEYYCFQLSFYDQTPGLAYVDLIKPGVTEKFIGLTMPGYEKAIGPEFGKTVPGIFTDEPHIRPPVETDGIRWTPDLFEQFQKRFGYGLEAKLPSLFEETGDWRKVRHDYYALLLDLLIDRWCKPWYNYTQSHQLLGTGHVWEHSWPSPQASPDHMAMYAWRQVPGIDALGNQFNEVVHSGFGNVRVVKELASVANQMGDRRKLCEAYGTAGWEVRFDELKRLGDWLYVLGVNLMNQHLSWMYSMGDRKADLPPTFSYQNPWWKHYTVLAEYYARLSAALSTGEEINRILVLEPTTSAWLYASPDAPDYNTSSAPFAPMAPTATAATRTMAAIGDTFQAFVTRLQYLQVEYDLASERIVRDSGKTAGAHFIVGRRSYDVVVVPPGMENVESSTLRLLEAYKKQGGKVIAFTSPAYVDGAPSARDWKLASSLDDREVQSALVPSDISSVDGPVFHQRRKLADGELLFFTNDSLDRPSSAELRLKGPSVVRLDLVTGRLEQYASRRVELPPAGSLLLYAGAAKVGAPAPPPLGKGESVASSGALQIRRIEPNVLTLDYCDLKIGGETESGLYYYQASQRAFQRYGLPMGASYFGTPGNPGDVVRNFPADSGFDLTYRFTVEGSPDRAALRAVVERPELWKVAINGEPITARPGEWAFDRAFGVYDIGAAVKSGENILTLAAHPMSVQYEIQPVYIMGDFAVTPQSKGFKVGPGATLALGSWKTQGLPFYADEVAYARNFKFDAKPARCLVRLGRWKGTVAEVRVNGKSAGIIGWQPYECDVTSLVKAGVNLVEVVVTGSAKNREGPLHSYAKTGRVSSDDFHTAPAAIPPGDSYLTLDYGLMEDFQVIRSAGR